MGTHYWLFPWIAIASGVLSLVVALIAGRRSFPEPTASIVTRGFLFVWLLVMIVGVVATLKLSTVTGAQWIESRGLVLGAIAGAVSVWLARRSSDQNFWLAPAMIGLATATVGCGQQWFNPGEINGLMSIAIGMALSLLCLCIAPAVLAPANVAPADFGAGRAVAALLFTVTLVAAVQLGFSKATATQDMYWADIPLLLAGALSLMLVIGAAVGRGGFSRPVGPVSLVVGGTLLVATIIAWRASHEWRIAIMPAIGVLIALVGLGLNRPTLPYSTARLGGYVSSLLIVLAATLCFAFWSGYGMALLAIGMWSLFAAPVFAGRRIVSPSALIGLGFATTLLIYRMAMLQSGSAVRASGPGDLWDLFAICLGALLPAVVADWARFEAADLRFPRPLVVLEWLIALIAPALALEYIWQPRSLAGVYLGISLGLLFANRAHPDTAERDPLGGADRVTVSAILISLVMFEFLPMLPHMTPPTRMVRVGIVLVLAALLLIRLFLPGRPSGEWVPRPGMEA